MLAGGTQSIDDGSWSSRLPAAAGAGMAAWLSDGGLLTPRLKSRAPTGFRLQLIAEYSRRLEPAERSLMGTPCREARVREIAMSDGGSAVVFAESLIPSATLERFPELGRLGDRPLGDALAGRDDVGREPFEYAVFEPGRAGYPRLPPDVPAERLFARRSIIRIDTAPILVVEFFRDALAGSEEVAM